MQGMRPLLLLDVDGVLCPFGAESYPDFEWYADQGIWYTLKNAERIRILMQYYKIAWCTAWGDDANNFISPLHNLPPFPVVDFPHSNATDLHWKQQGIAYFVGTRHYAFVDDDIDCESPDHGLWLPVKHHEGLTDNHVEKLLDFAANTAN